MAFGKIPFCFFNKILHIVTALSPRLNARKKILAPIYDYDAVSGMASNLNSFTFCYSKISELLYLEGYQ